MGDCTNVQLDVFLFLTLDGFVAEIDTVFALTPAVVPSMPISYDAGCYKEHSLRLQKVQKSSHWLDSRCLFQSA